MLNNLYNMSINESIFNIYKDQVLLREFSPDLLTRLAQDNNLKNLYLLCTKNGNKIDTLYEVYITIHSDERGVERKVDEDSKINYVKTCLECIPIDYLKIPKGHVRHVVFDMFAPPKPEAHSVVSLPCVLSEKAETTLTSELQQYCNTVAVLDIIVKTVIVTKTPQFSISDANNAAVHLPVATDGSVLSLDNVWIACNTPEINNYLILDRKQLPYNMVDRNNKRITGDYSKEMGNVRVYYPYNLFLDELHNSGITMNMPAVSEDYTSPKIQTVTQFIPSTDKLIDIIQQCNKNGYDIGNSPIQLDPNDSSDMLMYKGFALDTKHATPAQKEQWKEKQKGIPIKTPGMATTGYIPAHISKEFNIPNKFNTPSKHTGGKYIKRKQPTY